MKKEEPEEPIDEIRRIVRNWWTAWMEDDKLETRLKCFVLLGSEKFQIVAKHVFLEEISSGRYCVPVPAIEKLVNNFEEFTSSNEAQLAAKEGIINCLTIDDGVVYKVEKIIKPYLKNFGISENFIKSLKVKQAAEVAIANSLSSKFRNKEFCRMIDFFFPYELFSKKRHVYCHGVKQAARKWILSRLNERGVDNVELASEIKNIGTTFGVPDIFYSSAKFKQAMNGWILRFLDSFNQMSAETLLRSGYTSFENQESGMLFSINTLKDEFGIVEKIIYSPEVQQTIEKRRLKVKSISDKIEKQIKTILSNRSFSPY